MKKLVLSLLIVFIAINSIGQTQESTNKAASSDMVLTCHETAVYKLFPTQNMWTFIKLNTQNGKMWQVQFDVGGDDRLEIYLNSLPLAVGKEQMNGRFNLYPTENIYNFLLLDQIDGRVWQAQWSMEVTNRGIIPIE